MVLTFPNGCSFFAFDMKVWKFFAPYRSQSLVRILAIVWLGLNALVSGGALAEALPISVAQIAMTQQTSVSLPSRVIERIRQDLARRTGKNGDRFQIQSATAQTWPDGCLGLAKPSEFCTQVIIEGWRVVMTLEQKQWAYRSDRQGNVIRAE
jgi:hypothetical protein